MVNIIIFIHILSLIFSSSIYCSAQFLKGGNYRALIERANLFHLIQQPNGNTEEVPIENYKDQSFKSSSKEIKIIIHGWNAGRNHSSIRSIVSAYSKHHHDAVFVADWEDASRILYFDARYFVQPVAKKLTKLLEEFMRKNNIEASAVHLLGHSLGAHIAGNIGSHFGGKIARITGLDPAGPLFEETVTDGLLPKHATFVDCIHTDGPILGQLLPRGHVDFYPNGGLYKQPGCELRDVLTGSGCSHYMASTYYAESIVKAKQFPAVACPLKSITRTECLRKKFVGRVVYMGESTDKSARGTFFLNTNSRRGRTFNDLPFSNMLDGIREFFHI